MIAAGTFRLFSKFSILLLLLFLSHRSLSQNALEIYIASFAEGRDVKDVNFQLFNKDEKIIEQISKNGLFQFIILDTDEDFKLKATHTGYMSKEIHFNVSEYPFENEYEIQEIDIEFRKAKGGQTVEVGALKWNELDNSFAIALVDSTIENMKSKYAETEKTLGEIYITSIDNGDVLMWMGKYDLAKSHYEVALLAKPDDSYAKSQLDEIGFQLSKKPEQKVGIDKDLLDKINRGEINQVTSYKTTEDVIFSVQLGAFSGKVDRSRFNNVPDYNKIEYEDYTRVFSGEFGDINAAIKRLTSMRQNGYKDAWIVQMKGNKRIGF